MVRRSHGRRKTTFAAIITTTAVALLSPAAFMSAWLHAETLPLQVYSTALGETRTVVLGPGIAARLNTDSAMAVMCSPQRCEVTIDRGEALFDVDRTSAKPLRVVAGATPVNASHSRFSVRIRDARTTDVLVTAGQVTVDATTIAANHLARVSRAGIAQTVYTRGEALRRQDWTTGHLTLCGETLAEAVAEFNRYNKRKLVIADSSISSKTIGGKFRVHDLHSFIGALRPLGIRQMQGGASAAEDSILLVSSKKGTE